MNTELKEYIDAIAQLNKTIDSDDKFEFCTTYYNPEKNDKLTPNQQKYGYEPNYNEDALGLGVPEGFILFIDHAFFRLWLGRIRKFHILPGDDKDILAGFNTTFRFFRHNEAL